MLDRTYEELCELAIKLLNKGRADGVKHEPDTFRQQGYASQLVHAGQHIYRARVNWASKIDDPEDHLAHALTRILFAALLKEEAESKAKFEQQLGGL